MTTTRLRLGLLFAAFASAAAVGVALGSEIWGGLVPCALCLVERWPYRIAAGIFLLAAALPSRFARIGGWLAVATILAGAGVAFVHVGVEQHAWPSPLPECAAPRFSGGSIAERLASMPAQPSKSCEDGVFPAPFLPISYAGLNLIYALAFSAAASTFLVRSRRITP